MMADHYKVLGLNRDATKKEIKEAFRKLAIKFHPDKHVQASKSVKDNATIKFKQISEAYEVLIDDTKRGDYNFKSRYQSNNNYSSNFYSGRSNSSSYYGGGSYYSPPPPPPPRYSTSSYWSTRADMVLRYMTTRAFLLNVAFAGILLGGSVFIDESMDKLWKMRNSGKSFEEAMESVEKKKPRKQ